MYCSRLFRRSAKDSTRIHPREIIVPSYVVEEKQLVTHRLVPCGLLQATSMVLLLVGGCSGKGRTSGSPTIDAAVGGASGLGGVSVSTSATSSASGGRGGSESDRTSSGGTSGHGGTSDTSGTGGHGGSDGTGGSAAGGSAHTGGHGSGGASDPRGTGGVSGTGGVDASPSDGPFPCEYQGKLFGVGESVVVGCNSCTCDATHKMFVCVSNGCGLGGSSTDGGSGACGDPALKALFPSCAASTDAASCSERGGLWRLRNSGGTCLCPTGEGGCPCAASSDCLGHCSAWKDLFGGCDTAGPFTCSSFGGILGCWCRPEEPFAVCYP